MENHLMSNFKFAAMIPDHALGSHVWDIEGHEYIDLAGGIAVNALGHCHPELIQVINEQALKLWHISNLYTTEIAQELAEKLVRFSFADKVFFANSGAEANEAALKLARKAAFDEFGIEKNEIIACTNSFHGRTLFTVSVGGQPKYREGFAPLPAGIRHVPFNDCDALDAAITENTCAVIIEPIQGEGGVIPADSEFLRIARKRTQQVKAALIFDEVQTGMGRCGSLFTYEQYNIEPDILTTAKALGCGIPISATLATDRFAEAFTPGSHGTTFGGNPLACAVANRAFDLINADTTFENVNQQGAYLHAALNTIAEETGVFCEIRGLGLLIGAVLAEPYQDQAAALVTLALEEKVMVLQAGNNVIRFAPSLIINTEDIDEGIRRLRIAVERFKAQHQPAEDTPENHTADNDPSDNDDTQAKAENSILSSAVSLLKEQLQTEESSTDTNSPDAENTDRNIHTANAENKPTEGIKLINAAVSRLKEQFKTPDDGIEEQAHHNAKE